MRIRQIHIILSLFLATTLLFSQAGLGYFHDKHDAHEHIDAAQKDQTQLHKHGEHCQVCSIDLFYSLFINNDRPTDASVYGEITKVSEQSSFYNYFIALSDGRAPPANLLDL